MWSNKTDLSHIWYWNKKVMLFYVQISLIFKLSCHTFHQQNLIHDNESFRYQLCAVEHLMLIQEEMKSSGTRLFSFMSMSIPSFSSNSYDRGMFLKQVNVVNLAKKAWMISPMAAVLVGGNLSTVKPLFSW